VLVSKGFVEVTGMLGSVRRHQEVEYNCANVKHAYYQINIPGIGDAAADAM